MSFWISRLTRTNWTENPKPLSDARQLHLEECGEELYFVAVDPISCTLFAMSEKTYQFSFNGQSHCIGRYPSKN